VNLKVKNSKQLADMDATILNFQKTVENLNEGGDLLNRSAVFLLEGEEMEVDAEKFDQLQSSIAREKEMEAKYRNLKDEFFTLKERKILIQENLIGKSDNEDEVVEKVSKVDEIASVPLAEFTKMVNDRNFYRDKFTMMENELMESQMKVANLQLRNSGAISHF